MIYKSHLVELWVNGKKVELESQDSVNVRFNNTLLDPTKISSTQAEYSFEFSIPCTPNNNKIFNYANNLSKLNKFHTRWNAELYGDGTIIFKGTLTINSIKDNKYNVNLVSVKVKSLDDIFGEMTMNQIKNWKIDFNGVETINAINSMLETDVMFPLVSYGVFQKSPYNSDSVSNDYTSKFDLDRWNNWYLESFYPSHNMLATLRKAFESKDYIVGGDAFQDQFLNSIYMSVNLADDQDPQYNLGNPKLGSVNLTTTWSSNQSYTTQELNYPYLRTSQYNDKTFGLDPSLNEIKYNFSTIRIYDMLSEGTVSVADSSYLYQPNEHMVVIPADGFYKVEMSINANLNTSSSLTAAQWLAIHSDIDVILNNVALSLEESDLTFNPDFRITTPFEVQLVKNYREDEDNVELIKGKNNFMCVDGRVDNITTHGSYSNYRNFPTCFPHQKLGWMATWNNTLVVGQITPTETSHLGDNYTEKITEPTVFGYVYKDNDLMAYDPIVNPNFIMGATTMGNKNGGGCAAVIKNGYSWDKTNADKYELFYNQSGYWNVGGSTDNYSYTDTSVNQNTYPNAPQCTFSQSNNRLDAKIYALMYFKKNDYLRVLGIQRDYATKNGTNVDYSVSATVNLKVTAASPRTYAQLKSSLYGYNSQTEYDTQLNLANFFNQEKKVSEWVQNIADAFNLDITQDGNSVQVNVKKKLGLGNAAVDLDNRANTYNAESAMINYPRSMAVKYKIDTDEWGFERSAVAAAGGDESILNDDDWYKYGDSGFSEIILNDDSYETSKSEKNLPFSYTWYDNFNWYQVTSGGTQPTGQTPSRLSLPVISKYSYMIDGYDYDESMKHDGYGLSQRFWFKPSNSGCYVWTKTYPTEQVFLYEPSNLYTNYQDVYFNLSYKVTERSLLTEYFSINAYLASNYVNIDVFLSNDEYNMLKNGALVHFDSDIYYVCAIEGFDPSGTNETTLKLMKKVN